jgi:hypothetical protein
MCVTSLYHVLSSCFSRFRGAFDTRRDLAWAVHNHLLNVVSFSLYPIHYLSRTCEIPSTYNLPFFQSLNGPGPNDISYEGVTLTFHLVLVDETVDCSPRASLNFMEFFWANIKTFAFIKYAIVRVSLKTPKILFLRHYRAATDGLMTFNLGAACCRDCTPSIRTFREQMCLPKFLQIYISIICDALFHSSAKS